MVAPAKSLKSLEDVKPKRRKAICGEDIESIATLVVKNRLTETEACQHLGIRPVVWLSWKSKHKHDARFTDSLTRVRAAKIASYTESIENVGFTKDWRATAWLLERTEPDRFSDRKAEVTINLPAIPDQARQQALQAAYGAITVDCEPVQPKQIAEQSGQTQQV